VRIQVLTVANMKLTAFWNIASSSLVGVDRHFRGAYCLHHVCLKMETIRTCETSVYSNETTWRYIPESCYVRMKLLSNRCLECEISSSHGGEYEAQNLLGYTAVFLIECRPTFQRYVLPPSSGQYIPEDSELRCLD
jgi:hypothetical protein